jgi:hypothetical protein
MKMTGHHDPAAFDGKCSRPTARSCWTSQHHHLGAHHGHGLSGLSSFATHRIPAALHSCKRRWSGRAQRPCNYGGQCGQGEVVGTAPTANAAARRGCGRVCGHTSSVVMLGRQPLRLVSPSITTVSDRYAVAKFVPAFGGVVLFHNTTSRQREGLWHRTVLCKTEVRALWRWV